MCLCACAQDLISFKRMYLSVCACALSRFSRIRLFETLWTPARLLCPWDSPGKNTGVGCHALLQGIFLTQGSNQCLLCLLHCRQSRYCWAAREACVCLYSNSDHFVWHTSGALHKTKLWFCRAGAGHTGCTAQEIAWCAGLSEETKPEGHTLFLIL